MIARPKSYSQFPVARIIGYAAVSLLFSANSHAASVVNLDDKTHYFEFTESEHLHRITLKPKQRFTIGSRLFLQWKGREITIDADEEYAIWDDQTFGPQRRLRNNDRYY